MLITIKLINTTIISYNYHIRGKLIYKTLLANFKYITHLLIIVTALETRIGPSELTHVITESVS